MYGKLYLGEQSVQVLLLANHD